MLRRSLPNCMLLGKMIAKYFTSSRITYRGEQNRESFLATDKIDGASVAINKKNRRGPFFAAPDAPCVTGLWRWRENVRERNRTRLMCRQRERARGQAGKKGVRGRNTPSVAYFAWVGRSTATTFLHNPLHPRILSLSLSFTLVLLRFSVPPRFEDRA